MYSIIFREKAKEDLKRLKKTEPNAFKKALILLDEIADNPRSGTGHPEPLRGDKSGAWSRCITQKHRLVYEIHDTEVVVLVLTAYGHYDDK